jgi:hypothetical protein
LKRIVPAFPQALAVLAVLAALSAPTAPAAAFPGSRAWVAAGGGYAWPPAELGFGDDVLGVRGWQSTVAGVAGMRLLSRLAVEGRASLLSTSSLENLEILHGEGALTFFVPRQWRFEPFVTAGFGGVRADRDSGSDDTFAWSAGGGFLLPLTDLVGLRVDARRVSYRVNYFGEKAFRPQPELFAGLHFAFGGSGDAAP